MLRVGHRSPEIVPAVLVDWRDDDDASGARDGLVMMTGEMVKLANSFFFFPTNHRVSSCPDFQTELTREQREGRHTT